MRTTLAVPSRNVALVLLAWVALATAAAHRAPGTPAAVTAKLSEWKVELSEAKIAAGPVSFTVTNAGSIPHAFEVEGQGIERETELIQPGSTATLTLTLKVGTYEVYCPVGEDSHKKLGMETHLKVVASGYDASETSESHEPAERLQAIRVTGGGPVIQILPGPFPFPDSAAPIRSEEHTSELQSPCNLVCRLLLEKNKPTARTCPYTTRRRSPHYCGRRNRRSRTTPSSRAPRVRTYRAGRCDRSRGGDLPPVPRAD